MRNQAQVEKENVDLFNHLLKRRKNTSESEIDLESEEENVSLADVDEYNNAEYSDINITASDDDDEIITTPTENAAEVDLEELSKVYGSSVV